MARNNEGAQTHAARPRASVSWACFLEMTQHAKPTSQILHDGQAMRFDDTAVAFAHRSTRELKRARWMFGLIGAPWLVKLGSRTIDLAMTLRLPIGWALKPVFDYFCGGENIRESLSTADNLYAFGVQTILDFSAEGQTG